MKTMYLWQEAPFTDRANVYNNYVFIAFSRGDSTVFDFEEFNQLYHNHSFYSVAIKFRM